MAKWVEISFEGSPYANARYWGNFKIIDLFNIWIKSKLIKTLTDFLALKKDTEKARRRMEKVYQLLKDMANGKIGVKIRKTPGKKVIGHGQIMSRHMTRMENKLGQSPVKNRKKRSGKCR